MLIKKYQFTFNMINDITIYNFIFILRSNNSNSVFEQQLLFRIPIKFYLSKIMNRFRNVKFGVQCANYPIKIVMSSYRQFFLFLFDFFRLEIKNKALILSFVISLFLLCKMLLITLIEMIVCGIRYIIHLVIQISFRNLLFLFPPFFCFLFYFKNSVHHCT